MSDRDDELERLRAANVELEARAARAEEELRAARALHDATIESLPFDFWARDREGYCFSQNATTRANWGDLLHKRPEDMSFPREVIDLWLDNNRRALAGEIVRGDHSFQIGGETRWLHNVLAPIRMGDAIVGTLGVNVDITERQRALEALDESRGMLGMAADAARIGFWSWDLGSDEVKWDPNMCAIFGVAPCTSPRGREGFLAFVHPDDRARAAATIARGMKDGTWEEERRIVRGDGALRWTYAKGTIVRHAGRQVALGAVVDVTERVQRDERARGAQKLEAVGQLTAGIAHNFNNLLMAILPNLARAERGASPETLPALQSARGAAERAADLVRQLMTYARRNRPAEQHVLAVGPIVQRAVALCRTTFDRRIVIDERYEADARARVDEAQVEQALLNLLINARDAVATVAAPRIAVDAAIVRAGAAELGGRSGDFVRMRVIDDGVGMDAATRARAFEPFFTTKDGRGTGLGLATTQAIASDLGGWVACDSAPGRGATFALYVPLAVASAKAASEAPRPAHAARGAETVLIVDDEPAIRRVVAVMLREAGYATLLAPSGEEALALLGDGDVAARVALVLLDVSMPGMSRATLRARLRDAIPHARVVYFTGYALDAADADDAILEKPVSEAKLLATVREVLDRGAPA